MTPIPSPLAPLTPARDTADGTPSKSKATPDKQPKATPDKQPKTKPIDFGKAIGINKPANIQAKIRKWQAELGQIDAATENPVEAQVENVAPADASPNIPTTPKPKPLEEKKTPKAFETPTKPVIGTPDRPKSAKKPVHNRLDDEVRNASAPKKRVVSDSHWRTAKSPEKEAGARPEPKPIPTPSAWVRPKRVDKSETKVEAKSRMIITAKTKTNATAQRARRLSKPGISSPENKRRPGSGGSDKLEDGKKDSDDIVSPPDAQAATSPTSPTSPRSPRSPKSSGQYEVVRVRRRPRRAVGASRRGSASSRSSSSDGEVTRKKQPAHTPNASLGKLVIEVTEEDDGPRQSITPKEEERPRRRTLHKRARSLASPEEPEQEPASTTRLRSRRMSVHQDARDEIHPPRRMSVHQDIRDELPRPQSNRASNEQLEAPPRVFGTRVEAWLSATPDPFVDSEKRRRRRSKESESTSEVSSRKPEKSVFTESTESKTDITEPMSDRPVKSKQPSRSRRATIHVDAQRASEEPSVAALTDPAPGSGPVGRVEREGEGAVTPSPTLKRRGAKRTQQSPTKEKFRGLAPEGNSSPLEEVDAASSEVASSIDVPTLDVDHHHPIVQARPRPEMHAMRRLFPSTGKRLSTIASVETFNTHAQDAPPSVAVGSEAGAAQEVNTTYTNTWTTCTSEASVPASDMSDPFRVDVDGDRESKTMVSRRGTKRKLARHHDLMSVLSLPAAGTKSIVSARSIRSSRTRLATATIGDVMSELASDESKYMRELRTLVDGVIPVLLSCVLSKSDFALAAGLFSKSSAPADPSTITKPILDMGVALERLKTMHKRLPSDDPDSFVSWADNAQRAYSDYINSWRLGFQDVVVSLGPAEDDPNSTTKTITSPEGSSAWDQGLPRDAEGYVVNANGERVDVAYMLKRPLVRLKYLSKTLKGILHLKPSDKAEKTSIAYQNLVDEARKRSNDEKARFEDELAASTDPTRARDPRSLAPVSGVRIDPNRHVRARDHFDMDLIHSSGQEVSCRVQLLLRDDPSGTGSGGDVLICQVDDTGRWLFFPPIQQNRISACSGKAKGEIITMIRGHHSNGSEWHEVFSLKTNDELVGLEWVQMLGTTPRPPPVEELKRSLSLKAVKRPTSSHASSSFVSATTASTPPLESRNPSPHEVEIPIGERANDRSKRWGYETPDRKYGSAATSPTTPPSDSSGKRKTPPTTNHEVHDSRTQSAFRDEEHSLERTPRNLNEAMAMAGGSTSPLGLRRTKAKRLSRQSPQSQGSGRASRQIVLDDPLPEEPRPSRRSTRRQRPARSPSPKSDLSHSSKAFSVWIPSSDVDYSDESDESDEMEPPKRDRPPTHRRTSSTPSMDFPTIPRLRKSSRPSTPVQEPVRDDASEMNAAPASAPPKLGRGPKPAAKEEVVPVDDEKPPPVPPHRSPSPATPVALKKSNTPVLVPTLPGYKIRRRTSSPLKHEYEPSTATESSSSSETDADSSGTEQLSSDESDKELEEDDVAMPLMAIAPKTSSPKVSPPGSLYSIPNDTITPSQSASNTPYRAVPKGNGKAAKAVASIFWWSSAEKWELLHPDECSVVVIPGKLEVYELSAEHSKPLLADGDDIMPSGGKRPLIALELTPVVPLRKGTALDISFKSPPTEESRIRKGDQFMLRSRNPTECDELYQLIHQSRLNNPTYIALQNARGARGQSSWAEVMDRQNAARTSASSSSSFWNMAASLGRRSSYRASSTRAASVSAATESSVATMSTAFKSALHRFSFGRHGRFSSRDGSQSNNSFDSGSGGSGSSTPNMGGTGAPPPGIANLKVRFYERLNLQKWNELGSARLSIMLPDPTTHTTRMGVGSPGIRNPTQEKRILIVGSKGGEKLLDVTLPENCFERVGRTGIAVSVWEDVTGPDGMIGTVGAVGGVSGARARVFMIQMKTERECAYSFGLLGSLRY